MFRTLIYVLAVAFVVFRSVAVGYAWRRYGLREKIGEPAALIAFAVVIVATYMSNITLQIVGMLAAFIAMGQAAAGRSERTGRKSAEDE